VPGSGFGRAGYFRLSLTIPLRTIERALPGFERALHKLKLPARGFQAQTPGTAFVESAPQMSKNITQALHKVLDNGVSQ
jgi:hypothetical protein